MSQLHKDLQTIQECLNEFEAICADSSFQDVLNEIKKHSFLKVQFENYKIGSHTLSRSKQAQLDLEYLKNTFDLIIQKKINLQNKNDLFLLNQNVLGLKTATQRTELLLTPYHYPSPNLIGEGLDLLYSFLQEHSQHLFLARIAFIQGLLSLHPFSDGNHRTCRLVLGYWLFEMNLPTTTIRKGTDLLISNPVDGKVFSLKQAVQKIIHAIGETILDRQT